MTDQIGLYWARKLSSPILSSLVRPGYRIELRQGLRLNPIQGGGGQKRLRATSSLNFDKNNHRMRL